MERLKAEDFYKAFLEKIGKDKNKQILTKNWNETSKYTKIMTQLVIEIGEERNYNPAREYWPRVDVAYFDKETDSNWDEYSMEVAIELENNSGTWNEEFNKLIAINAGLKVIVTYEDSEVVDLEKWLNSDKESVFRTFYKSRKYHQLDDKYLIIFGPTSLNKKETRGTFVGFEFDGKTFKQLDGELLLAK
jgi:hypothetical protein